ncbi:MAG: GNAT family N-acetyltransferase [Eudoraea sp.]|jgi:predicted GNAT family N-acyltransferase|uniref:GNAT family N-acetyltransferase n=1 Tax=Eudoraea sp. TaxID=1979955 RepID=UPI00260C7226|nr:GNAT family N-acetyltransferase [uncultured Eudoraea sp.]
MTIQIGRVQSRLELEQILSLQKKNIPKALSIKEIEQEGFLTVTHSLDLLDRMNSRCPHIIAKENDEVIGYALCMHPKFNNEIDILKPMFEEINSVLAPGEKFMVMGQVCIQKEYRKKGVFQKLYKKMQDVLKTNYNCIITEVDALNKRSLNAHFAVGFIELKTYNYNGRKWCLLALK